MQNLDVGPEMVLFLAFQLDSYQTKPVHRVARVVAEKVLFNVLLHVPPITETDLQLS